MRPRLLRRLESATILGGDAVAVGLTLLVAPSLDVGLLAALMALVGASVATVSRHRIALSVGSDSMRLATGLAVAITLTQLATASAKAPAVSTIQIAALVVGIYTARAATYAFIRRFRAAGAAIPTAIVGAGAVGVELHKILDEHREYGLVPVGFIDTVHDHGAPLLGELDDFEAVVDNCEIGCVIVAFGPSRDVDLVRIVRKAARLDIEVFVVPRFFDVGVLPAGSRIESLWGISVYRVREAAHRRGAWPAKRLFDLIVAGLAMTLLAPLLGAIAAAVKLTSPGPILFRQTRIGQHGRPFEMLKFRSMRVNDDSDTTWSVSDDDRVTSVGRFLRRTSLDELPQLWNVIRGEMAIVGPRPERPFFVDQYGTDIDGYAERHRLPVGLTGLAQVNGLRGDTSIEDRVRLDNHYVEEWSPWLDITLIARTISEVVTHARNGQV